MRIIVTGSSGLLAQAVCHAAIEAGNEVLGLDMAPKPEQGAWAHVAADLTDSDTAFDHIQNADAVFHIAAIPRPLGFDADTVFNTNMALTFNVVEANLRAGIHNLVYASSCSVFGFPFFVERPRLEYLPLDDRHPAAPQDCYALSKWLGEEVVEAACRRAPLRATGLRRVSVPAANAYEDVLFAAEMRQQFPECRIPETMTGCIDSSHAKQILGFTAQYSWRDYPKL